MIKTAATAVIQGVTYKLTPLTIAVEKRKQEITALEGKYNAGVITYEDVVREWLSFIRETANCHIWDNIPLENVDTNEVACAVIAIIKGYQRPLIMEQLKSVAADKPKKKIKKKGKK